MAVSKREKLGQTPFMLKYYSRTVTHGKNFRLRFLRLVNRLYAVIHKTQKL